MTQTNQPPANQERFKIDTWLHLEWMRHTSSRPPPHLMQGLSSWMRFELLLSRDSALKLTSRRQARLSST